MTRRETPRQKRLPAAQASTTPVDAPEDGTYIDTSEPHDSRVYDYLLGGTDNFAIDRQAAEHVFAAYPGGLEGVRIDVRTNRAFLGEVVRYLVHDMGIRQVLDIGTGIPNADNAHSVAQELAPETRVVYVDNDPIVLAHAHVLLRTTPEGATAYILEDLRRPEQVLEKAARTLDLRQPVGVLLIGVLHVIPDSDDPHSIVAELMDAVPSGSYLAISQLASDVEPEDMAEVSQRVDETMGRWNPAGFRSRAAISRFFDGLEVIEPGVVGADRWLEARASFTTSTDRAVPVYCAVGRKP